MDFNCVKCPICLDIMVQACALRCGHSFCELCLDEAVNSDDRCPECRQPTQGICIPNLRLNDCIYAIVRRGDDALNEYNRRKAQNQAELSIRREARAILFSVLYNAKKPLTSEQIEHAWKRLRNCNSIQQNIKDEMLRIINQNRNFFEVTCQNGESVVSMRRSDGAGDTAQ
ncbi:zinc finger, C3HC4 type [Ancylostoma ceylanicum]|uniref:Zinc finger, C3HC4 type n=2 Tax=Ancylostoma ceylanicum TaxID=53326 RepID=A0A0D6LTW9_9BILA|nr:zinc finger, C3HC4 type [Ancylostoma ceylanicum]EYC28516.1 hypothetical protein Y032_0007g3266 [Ancylostoma ceylanicum]